MTEPTMTADTLFARAPDITASAVDGELVMMDIDSGRYYRLNGVATHVWEALDRPKSAQELCLTLQAAYDVEWDRCLREVSVLLHDLQRFGLVTPGASD